MGCAESKPTAPAASTGPAATGAAVSPAECETGGVAAGKQCGATDMAPGSGPRACAVNGWTPGTAAPAAPQQQAGGCASVVASAGDPASAAVPPAGVCAKSEPVSAVSGAGNCNRIDCAALLAETECAFAEMEQTLCATSADAPARPAACGGLSSTGAPVAGPHSITVRPAPDSSVTR
jgi:hypothetical protein